MTIGQALDRAADKYPDRPLFITDERVWTYADMQAASRQLATRLLSRGIGPRDHVGLYMANYVEFAIAKFAIARIGAVAVPINFLLRQQELAYVLRQSECAALIAMDSFRDRNYLDDLDAIMPGWETSGGGVAFPELKEVFIHFCGGS